MLRSIFACVFMEPKSGSSNSRSLEPEKIGHDGKVSNLTDSDVAADYAFGPLHHVQLAIPAGGEDECRTFWGAVLGLVELTKPPALAGRGTGDPHVVEHDLGGV